MRGQTYDSASNMSGCYKGCQAIICQEQPLALCVHCGAHCVMCSGIIDTDLLSQCNEIEISDLQLYNCRSFEEHDL